MGDREASLHDAAKNGNLGRVKDLIERGVNVDAKDHNNRTALINAATYGNLDVVKYLVEQGANKEAIDLNSRTALIRAAASGKLNVVKYLVEQGSNKEAVDSYGRTALVRVAKRGNLDMVKYLVEQGANKEAVDLNSRTALIRAAAYDKLNVVKYLVEQGSNKEAIDSDGWTALIRAAKCNNLDVVRYLVEQEASNEAIDLDALIRAAKRGNLDMVKYLIEQGANKEAIDHNSRTALIYATVDGNLDGKTVLMQAASEGDLEKVKHLVGRGDDLEVKDKDGRTALMYAAIYGKLDVVKYFVSQDADASCVDNDGNSLLHHLLAFTDRTWWNMWIARPLSELDILPIAKLLLDHGMPLDSNRDGESARFIAKSRNFLRLADLLKKYERKRLTEEIQALKSRRRPEPEEEAPSWAISPDQIDIQSPLAEGGYGVVHLAVWGLKIVAVKQITVVEMRKFLKEVETWHKLNHPNIVRFYRANYKKQPYFIVSDYASNGELVKYLKDEKKNGRTVTWQKLYEVAVGLSYLHEEKLVHGDLKGNNIVVSEDGTAMLTDFGLTFSEDGSCSLANKKDTLGAMAWRAPEFAIPDSTIRPTQKSDVYSLGMCIVEAVTCEKPWGAHSNEKIRGFLRQGEIKVEKPSEMSGEQWQVVKRMSAVRPDDRPDVDEVLPELKRFADAERDAEFKADQRKRCPF